MPQIYGSPFWGLGPSRGILISILEITKSSRTLLVGRLTLKQIALKRPSSPEEPEPLQPSPLGRCIATGSFQTYGGLGVKVLDKTNLKTRLPYNQKEITSDTLTNDACDSFQDVKEYAKNGKPSYGVPKIQHPFLMFNIKSCSIY